MPRNLNKAAPTPEKWVLDTLIWHARYNHREVQKNGLALFRSRYGQYVLREILILLFGVSIFLWQTNYLKTWAHLDFCAPIEPT